MSKGNETVFPLVEWTQSKDTGEVTDYGVVPGITKREYFGAMVLQGLVSKYSITRPSDPETLSDTALKVADAFIKALAASEVEG